MFFFYCSTVPQSMFDLVKTILINYQTTSRVGSLSFFVKFKYGVWTEKKIISFPLISHQRERGGKGGGEETKEMKETLQYVWIDLIKQGKKSSCVLVQRVISESLRCLQTLLLSSSTAAASSILFHWNTCEFISNVWKCGNNVLIFSTSRDRNRLTFFCVCAAKRCTMYGYVCVLWYVPEICSTISIAIYNLHNRTLNWNRWVIWVNMSAYLLVDALFIFDNLFVVVHSFLFCLCQGKGFVAQNQNIYTICSINHVTEWSRSDIPVACKRICHNNTAALNNSNNKHISICAHTHKKNKICYRMLRKSWHLVILSVAISYNLCI